MNKKQVIGGVVVVVLAFAFGRYSAPEKIKEVRVVDTVKDTRTITIKKPDGTFITDVSTHHEVLETHAKEVTKSGSRTRLSILAGVSVLRPADGLSYGAHVSTGLLGPVSIGAFGMANGVGGLSVGIDF